MRACLRVCVRECVRVCALLLCTGAFAFNLVYGRTLRVFGVHFFSV